MNRTDIINSCENLLLALALDGMDLSEKVKMLSSIIPENCKSLNIQNVLTLINCLESIHI
jgi:hypothetical protein